MAYNQEFVHKEYHKHLVEVANHIHWLVAEAVEHRKSIVAACYMGPHTRLVEQLAGLVRGS